MTDHLTIQEALTQLQDQIQELHDQVWSLQKEVKKLCRENGVIYPKYLHPDYTLKERDPLIIDGSSTHDAILKALQDELTDLLAPVEVLRQQLLDFRIESKLPYPKYLPRL